MFSYKDTVKSIKILDKILLLSIFAGSFPINKS